MANAVTMGRAYVVIGAKISSEFTAALASVRTSIASVGQSMQRIGAPIMAVGSAITGALEGATYAAIKGQEAFADMATRTGMSAEFLSEVGYAAGLADISIEQLETSLVKMALAQQNLRQGMKTTVDQFAELGITAKDLEGLSPEEVFNKIADALSKIGDQAKKATIARGIFGRGGVQMLPLIGQGARGIAAGRAEAVRVGASVTGEAAAKADEAGDMFNRLSAAIQGLANAVGNVLMDRLIQLVTILTNLVARTSEYVRAHPELIAQAQQFGIALVEVGAAITGVGVAIEGMSYLLSPGGIFTIAAALVLYLTGTLDGLITQWKDTVLAFQVGGRSVGEWLGLIAKAWEATLPALAAIVVAIGDTFISVWNYIKQGAVFAFDSIGAAITATFWEAVQGVADSVIWMLRKVTEAEYALHLIDDKQIGERMTELDRWKANADAAYKGLANKASDDVIAPTLQLPDFSKAKASIATALTTVSGTLGAPIADAFAGVFGKGSSTVKSITDIFQDLSRPFESAPAKVKDQQTTGGAFATARRVDFESRGTFSGRAVGQLTNGESAIVKGQEKQLAVQMKIADNTKRIADNSEENDLTYD